MLKHNPSFKLPFVFLLLLTVFITGCISPGSKVTRAKLLDTSDANKAQLLTKINNFADVNSINAKMYLKFEDNSYADQGIAEKYKTADSTIVVQRPSSIRLTVELPIIGTDVAKMTSDGEKFRVAVLEDGAGGKYRRFILGTNKVDYSALQKTVDDLGNRDAKDLKENVNAFSNLRPQHFTDAMLMRRADTSKYVYVQSTILQEEYNVRAKKKSPLRWVLRGYYLLDEFLKSDNGKISILRRFWFDRVGGINLARQQIFDDKGEIESDIVYGKVGDVTASGKYKLPWEVQITRPKEKYKIRLIFKAPKAVKIGKTYTARVFVLENEKNLEEVDLDKKLLEMKSGSSTQTSTQN